MKRKVVCVFSLVLFLILFCTVLSPWVSREMQTLVEIKKITGKMTMRNPSVTAAAIHFPETDGVLFQIVEGEGWQSGSRVEEVARYKYSNHFDFVAINAGVKADVIVSASRQPVAGDAVQVVEEFTEGEDTFLILWGDSSLNNCPNTFKWLDSSEIGTLASFHKAKFPYFEHRYQKSMENLVIGMPVFYIDPDTGELKQVPQEEIPAVRVYSMTETRQFLESLPYVAGIGVLLVFGIFLWVYGCVLSRKGWKKPLRNAVLGAATLGGLHILLGHIDLPASMLPPKNILDISHYTQNLSAIRTELAAMENPILNDAFSYALRGSLIALGIGIAAMAAVLLLDRLWKEQ